MSICLIAGEPSGDLHGAALIEKLLKLDPTLQIFAVAGPEMRKFPIEVIEPMESFCVMGFIDVIYALPKLVKLFFKLKREILKRQPKKVVTIDYPGLNLRLQKSLRKSGYLGTQIHYICPTVWAWGKKRIALMEQSLDLLLTILPFEPKCFASTSLHVEYVGHPLIQKIQPTHVGREKILALFPGSRQKEIDRNLPLQLAVADRLAKLDPALRIVVSTGQTQEERYDLMQKAHLALAKSGTVTLELALHGTPTVVQYVVRPFDEFLATKIFRINLPYYSLPNLLVASEVFPELFGSNLSVDALFEKARTLWFDEQKNQQMREATKTVRGVLGDKDASLVAARKIIMAEAPCTRSRQPAQN